jgi:hypothetical protein
MAQMRNRKRTKEEALEDLSFLQSPAAMTPLTPPLPPAEERRVVRDLLDQAAVKMTVGTTYYVVNFKWWQLWQHYVGWNDDDGGEGPTRPLGVRQRPGPIDNTELLEESSSPAAPSKGTTASRFYLFIYLFILI